MAIYFKKLYWTEHSKIKMKQYGLSKQKILGILSKPERKEKGIASGTTAAMKTNKTYFSARGGSAWGGKEKKITLSNAWRKPKRAPGEIWLMYQDIKNPSAGSGQVRKIISAWRYPGVSKPGEEIPIPDDIKQEIIRGNLI